MKSRSYFVPLSGVGLLSIILILTGGTSIQASTTAQLTATTGGVTGTTVSCPPVVLAAAKAATAPATQRAIRAATQSATQAPGTASAGCLFAAVLKGPNEAPDPGDPAGHGAAIILVDMAKGQICYQVMAVGMKLPASAAHIHKAPAGTAGQIVVPFQAAPDATGFATGCTTGVDPTLMQDILQNPANYYVNVHNADFPNGAMRGQLASAVRLLGADEAPKQGDLKGNGAAVLALDSQKGEVCYDLMVVGIKLPAAAAHIHKGAVGMPGPIVVPFQTPPDASGLASGCVEGVAANLVTDILRNPAGYYVNVHNADFPDGALRGQLASGVSTAATAAPTKAAPTRVAPTRGLPTLVPPTRMLPPPTQKPVSTQGR